MTSRGGGTWRVPPDPWWTGYEYVVARGRAEGWSKGVDAREGWSEGGRNRRPEESRSEERGQPEERGGATVVGVGACSRPAAASLAFSLPSNPSPVSPRAPPGVPPAQPLPTTPLVRLTPPAGVPAGPQL
ncbi:hypothetical protein KM043_009099 [Ampulex compressa]|nr:hypothetical protein KM043_009099 [Ampulex compressa]